MRLSKIQIALYATLAAGVIAILALELPRWLIFPLMLVVGVVDYRLDRNRPPQLSKGKRDSRGRENWMLLALSLVFCAGGALLLSSDAWRIGVVTITFFGACAIIFVASIRRKRRERRLQGATVRVTGGVNIYANGPQMGVIAFGCCVVGAVMYFVGVGYPLLFRILGAFLALVGVALAIGVAMGTFSRRFIRFEPEAVIFGEYRYTYRVPWDEIAAVVPFDYADNPFVGIHLHSVDAVSVEPPSRTPDFRRLVANHRGLMGTDLAIAAGLFGIDGPVLAGALHRYASDPEARAELVPRPPLTHDPARN